MHVNISLRLDIPPSASTDINEIHDFKIDHRCGSQCSECRSFCRLPHGHTDSYHSTNTHRVKYYYIEKNKYQNN